MKTLKFAENLVPLVLSGEKDVTWRLFDDKDLKEGDRLSLCRAENGEEFSQAVIVSVFEKRMGDIDERDFGGTKHSWMRRRCIKHILATTEIALLPIHS